MNESELKVVLDDLLDRFLLFHGFTNFMRDYDLVVYETVDPRSGLSPRHLRFRFRFCTEAHVCSRVRPEVWVSSLSDELLRVDRVTREARGYIWGIQAQEVYPGAMIVEGSARAQRWQEQVGIPFHEVRIEANAQEVRLVFSDLIVEALSSGYSPYVVGGVGVPEQYADGVNRPLDGTGPP